jgi:hypothetical protein
MENNKAFVAILKHITPIEGADKIVQAQVYLNGVPITQVIVGVNTKEDTPVVYFDSNVCLSDRLVTDYPDLATYLAKDNRVRCIKLRGVVSNGLCIDIVKFAKYTAVEMPEGYAFDKLGDVEICHKFIPLKLEPTVKHKNRERKAKKPSRIIPEMFHFHIDTEQLPRNMHKLHIDDVVSISRKYHGCFTGRTLVSMGDGTKKRIKDIVVGDSILGCTEEGGVVLSKVLNTFMNGTTDKWYRIKYRGRKILHATGTHRIYTQRGYVEVQDLTPQDKIIYPTTVPILDIDAKSVLLGKALGDGCLQSNADSLMLQVSHKNDHEQYLDYCISLLHPIDCGSSKTHKTSGYGTDMIRWHSSQTHAINHTLKAYLSDKKFKITEALVNDLTPLALAIWYMDDGSLIHSELQQDRAGLAICSFGPEVYPIIGRALAQYGIENVTFYTSHNKGNPKAHSRIRFNLDAACKLFELIKEYIPPCMQYKLPVEYRGYYKSPTIRTSIEYEQILVPYSVVSVEQVIADGYTGNGKYDIETETHNYIANGIVVHNCSAITSHTQVKKSLSIFEKVLKVFKFPVGDREWTYLYASRSVVKNDAVSTGFYKYDLWTETGKKYFDGKLHKGETVYYEIIGYIPGTKSFIQKNYDYANLPGDCSIVVYRITSTNTDGVVYEYSWAAIKDRCKELGVHMVQEYYYGTIRSLLFGYSIRPNPEWNADLLALLQKRYLERDCPDNLCKKMPDEGIVLRVEAKDIQVYKYKSEKFLTQESKAKEDEVPDIEEQEGVL